jgi:serine protease AprX
MTQMKRMLIDLVASCIFSVLFSNRIRTIILIFVFASGILVGVDQDFTPIVQAQGPEKITSQLLFMTANGASAEFFVILADQADLSGADALAGKAKTRYVYETLWTTAQTSQASLKDWLAKRGVSYRAFYITNALLVKGDQELLFDLAARPEVARLEANVRFRSLLPIPQLPKINPDRSPGSIESNLTYVNADDIWAMGFTGQGIVIGGQDTGYDWDHPALINQYRGWDGQAASHDYNWHDSIHTTNFDSECGTDSPEPCDDNNHGSHTMGIAIGADGANNQIGLAPGAQWIGCRNMDEGWGSPATYLECFEFFLAPYPIGGTPADGIPELAPDVTINSWSCPQIEGCFWHTLQDAVEAHRAAGIMTVVAAGNGGPNCSTISTPPSLYDAAYSVGALLKDIDTLAGFSSRGPVVIDGSKRRKPDLAAPGTSIRSSIRGGGYAIMSGTSMAAPHVAGAVALLWSVVPNLTNNIEATEAYLNEQAVHLFTTECDSTAWPNNLYGYGRLDILAAVEAARIPKASFSHSPVLLNSPTTFFNLTTGQSPITSTWNFGDGTIVNTTGTLPSLIQHTFTTPNTYTVILTANNAFGQSTFTQTIALADFDLQPRAAFTYTQPVLVNQPAFFTNTTAGGSPITSTWSFGDDTLEFSTGTVLLPVQHTYTTSGHYTVTLTATNGYGQSIFSDTVAVLRPWLYLPILRK